VRPTRRGAALLAAAVLLIAAGAWLRFPVAVALGAAAAAAVLAALLVTARPPRVRVHRTIRPELVERGRPAVARLRIGTGARRLAGLRAVEPVGPDTRALPLPDLASGAEVVREYDVPTATRGRLIVGPLVVDRSDPLGLARHRVVAGDAGTVQVHPRQWPARPPSGRRRAAHEDGTADAARRGGAELWDVREYLPGDEVRHLHWKATARAGRLMVRDLSDPRRSRLTVLLDTRPRALTAAQFDEAVDVAASLLAGAARAGHPARLVTAAGREVAVDDAYAIRPMLDALSELRQEGSAMLPAGSAGGDLVVVTGDAADGWRLRAPGAVLIVLGGPETAPGEVAGVRVIRAPDAERALRLWNGAHR
jgi:uncharacterized protein (DUF58 family)